MNTIQESPDYVRLSQAAAMTLDLLGGSFYRDAKLYCINILLTYSKGCSANCAYCGLSKVRPGEYEEKSFIRVAWPIHSTDDIADRIAQRPQSVKRVCISMITQRKAVTDAVEVAKRIRAKSSVPISSLVSPTVMVDSDYADLKNAGVDKVGIAIDCATEELFDLHRGIHANGPHKWDKYWTSFEAALKVFGKGQVGSHFVVGLGETEKQMIESIQRIKDMGGETHLFSFFPEANSRLANHARPSVQHYRRVQISRYMIDNELTHSSKMKFDDEGRVVDFGADFEPVARLGKPFMTSGCIGEDGEVACNRPFANERPSEEFRNFPFLPEPQEIEAIIKEIRDYSQ
jgi:biotin synthase